MCLVTAWNVKECFTCCHTSLIDSSGRFFSAFIGLISCCLFNIEVLHF